MVILYTPNTTTICLIDDKLEEVHEVLKVEQDQDEALVIVPRHHLVPIPRISLIALCGFSCMNLADLKKIKF